MTLCLFGCVCRIQCSQPRSWLRRTADWRAFVRKAWNLLQYASEKKKRRFYGSACGTCRDAKVRFLDLRHFFRHALSFAYPLYDRHLEVFGDFFETYINKRVEALAARCALQLSLEAEHLGNRHFSLYYRRAHFRLHVHDLASSVLHLIHGVAHELIRHIHANRLHGLKQRRPRAHNSLLYRVAYGRQHLRRTAVYSILVQLRVQYPYLHARARLAAYRPCFHYSFERFYYKFHCLVKILYTLCPVHKRVSLIQVRQALCLVAFHAAFKQCRYSVFYEFSYVFLFELAACYSIVNSLFKRLYSQVEPVVFV